MNKMFPTEYIQGFRVALLMVREGLTDPLLATDLKIHKIPFNRQTIIRYLDCMIENRVILRENPDAFIRCNNKIDGGFEVYIEGVGPYNSETGRIENGQ